LGTPSSSGHGRLRPGGFAYASQPKWEVPVAGGIGFLSVAESGAVRVVTINGAVVGAVSRAQFATPWTEFAFERAGHRFVVAEVFGINRMAPSEDENSTAELFVDGVNVRNHRTLDEWRLKSAHPIDRYAFATEVGWMGIGNHPGWEVVLVLVGVVLAMGLLQGWSAPFLALGVAGAVLVAAWLEGLAEIQDWLQAHHDWTVWRRMAIFAVSFAVFVVPIAVLVWNLLRARSTRPRA
jgi:hypothetical protein